MEKEVMPKITVAIPVYNVEKYILRCIESVINQTFSDIEVVVVNDKTKDNSISIVEDLAKKDSRIRIIEHSENKGLMCARKTGYENAVGKYVFFLDSDDSMPENALQLLYEEAERSQSDIVAGRLTYIKPSCIDDKSFPCALNYGNDRCSVIKSTLLWEMTHTLCGKLFKRDLFVNSSYNTLEHYTNGEDGLLYYQILEKVNKVTCIDKCVYYYYQNSESSTQVKYSEKTIKSILYLYDYRYKVVEKITSLKKLLNLATTKDLCVLCGMGYERKYLNMLLNDTCIPIRLKCTEIMRNCGFVTGSKCLLRVYLMSYLRKNKK